ncbi:MAG: DNA-formamidopyrimidine glycosylase [Bacillota bacterium]
MTRLIPEDWSYKLPELPEVETIRQELEPLIRGKTFAEPILHMPSTIAYPSPEEFSVGLEGRTATALTRRGKYLFINLDQNILTVHLRMTGNLLFSKTGLPAEDRFLRVTLPFTDGTALHYLDMRRFGRLWLTANRQELETFVLKNVGPDILNEVNLEEFIELLGKRQKAKLKALLLDQNFVAGLGNIYTDECLYRCGLHPERAAGTLDRDKGEELYKAIQDVLADGIKYGGTTFRDYRSASGALGQFQQKLEVYGRKDDICPCGTPIKKKVVAGRGTYYCPRCQK